MNVIYFCAGDKDDYNVLTPIISLCKQGKINLIGIVCEDAFLKIEDNILMTYFWVTKILQFSVNIYKGVNRNEQLVNNNSFPEIWSSSFIDEIKQTYNYNPNSINYEALDINGLIYTLNLNNYNDIKILTCSNMTTLSYIINNSITIQNKIFNITSMISNFQIYGNIEMVEPPVDSEYNAYLDPISFSNVVQKMGNKMCIVPLDVTQYVPLTNESIEYIKQLGLVKGLQNNYLFQQFLKILKSSISTVDTHIYMWNTVALTIFLNLEVSLIYITPSVSINEYGKIINNLESSINPKIYISINSTKFWNQVVDLFITLVDLREYLPFGTNYMNKRISNSICNSSVFCEKYFNLFR